MDTDGAGYSLKEFKETESANLSVRDFRTMWLEKEADPPAFTKARKEQEKNSKDKELSVSSSSSSSSAEEEEATEDQSRPTSRRLPIVIAEETTPVTTPSPSVGASTPGVEDRTQEESQSSLSETLVPSQSDDATQATLVNPTLQREAQELEKEMNEWMQDGSFIKATESLGTIVSQKGYNCSNVLTMLQNEKLPKKPLLMRHQHQLQQKKRIFLTLMTKK